MPHIVSQIVDCDEEGNTKGHLSVGFGFILILVLNVHHQQHIKSRDDDDSIVLKVYSLMTVHIITEKCLH